MKLVWHELKYLSLRLGPVFLIYLLILGADLLDLMVVKTEGNLFIAPRYFITPLGCLFVIYLFSGISPSKRNSSCRLRPIENWQLFASRALWIFLFMVVPRSLHELLVVGGNGFGASISLSAACQIAVEDCLLYLMAAIVGWLFGSLWVVVGIAIGFYLLFIILMVCFPEGQTYERGEMFFGVRHTRALFAYLCFAGLLGVIAVWLGVAKRFGGNRWVRFGVVPILVAGYFFVLGNRFDGGSINKLFSRWASTVEATEPFRSDLALDTDQPQRSFRYEKDSEGKTSMVWDFTPSLVGLPDGWLATLSLVEASLVEAGKSERVRLEQQGLWFESTIQSTAVSQRLMSHLGSGRFLFHEEDPRSQVEMKLKAKLNEEEVSALRDRGADFSAKVKLRFDLFKFSDPEFFSMDGPVQHSDQIGKIHSVKTDSQRLGNYRVRFQEPAYLWRKPFLREPIRIFFTKDPKGNFHWYKVLTDDRHYKINRSSAPFFEYGQYSDWVAQHQFSKGKLRTVPYEVEFGVVTAKFMGSEYLEETFDGLGGNGGHMKLKSLKDLELDLDGEKFSASSPISIGPDATEWEVRKQIYRSMRSPGSGSLSWHESQEALVLQIKQAYLSLDKPLAESSQKRFESNGTHSFFDWVKDRPDRDEIISKACDAEDKWERFSGHNLEPYVAKGRFGDEAVLRAKVKRELAVIQNLNAQSSWKTGGFRLLKQCFNDPAYRAVDHQTDVLKRWLESEWKYDADKYWFEVLE